LQTARQLTAPGLTAPTFHGRPARRRWYRRLGFARLIHAARPRRFTSMECQSCGERRPTRHVVFYQNIGMVIMRSSKTVDGELCKDCINKVFWNFTLITLVFGWWGMISLIVTPLFLINNIARFVGTTGMKPHEIAPPAPKPGAELTDHSRARLTSFVAEMQQRLAAGEPRDEVCGSVARRAGVSALQAELMADEIAAGRRDQASA
jgi:hypothetical protein